MTKDGRVVSGQRLASDTADGALVELDQVQKHAIELLAQLDRPPRNLRIQAGAVTVDITWADSVAGPDVRRDEAVGAGHRVPGQADDIVTAEYLTSPGVGVFYHAREPGAEPFVSVGSVVHQGQQIGIIEAMKLMIPVEADRAGTITVVLKANGEPVEYGEPLFALAAEEA